MTKKTLAVCTLAILLGLASIAALGDGSDTYSIYDIRVTLDPSAQTLVGTEQVDYINDTDHSVNELLFQLIANTGAEPNPYLHPAVLDTQYVSGFDPTWTQIHHVTDASGNPLSYHLEPLPPVMQTYSLDNGILSIPLATPLAPGERITVMIGFETRFAHARTLDQCVYRDTYVWRFGWNPIAVPPSTRDGGFTLPAAEYRVELAVPDAYRVLGGADRQTVLGSTSGLTTYLMTSDHAVRSVPLVIGSELGIVHSTWNGVDLEAAYLPGDETSARLALSYAEEILAAHSERLGPFGYERFVIVDSPTPGFYGMAADGMILIGRSLARLKDMPVLGVYDRLFEYLLAHETAHLWWGIGIGTDFDAENWISEGFAEYVSISYFETTHGEFEPNVLSHLGDGLLEDVISEQFGYLNLRQHFSEAMYVDLLRLDFDEAIIQPMADVGYANGQTVRTYNKGYLVLRALEALIGRETLEAVLVEANTLWRGRTLTVEVFEQLAEDVSGKDLSAFFDGWLHGDDRFDVGVDGFEIVRSDLGFSTAIQLRHDGIVLPVTVRTTLADQSIIESDWLPDCCTTSSLNLETSAPVVSVHVDPNEMLPDGNRFDNHYPRQILIDHPFRPDTAPPIGRPLDAYVIDIQPMGVSGSFRNDHMWSISVLPHIDQGDTPGELADAFGAWDLTGMFAADIDRRLSYSARADISALDIAGLSGDLNVLFTTHVRGFTHPQIGSTGTYWYPTSRLDLTIGVRGPVTQAIPFASVSIIRSDPFELLMNNAITLQAGIPGFGSDPFVILRGSAEKRFRLAALFYIDITAEFGGSLLDTVPTDFMFSMERLQAFALPPAGIHQMFGRARLSLPPIARDDGYAIFNLTRLEDVAAGAYIQGGRTWGGCDRTCESGIRLEAGGLITLRFDGFLGSMIQFSIGYAYPLIGPEGVGTPFIEFVTPF